MATIRQTTAFSPGVYRGNPFTRDRLKAFVDGTNRAIAAGISVPLLKKHAKINASDKETEQFAVDQGQGVGWVTKFDIGEDGGIIYEAKDVPQDTAAEIQAGTLKLTSPEFRNHYSSEKSGVYEGPIIRHMAFTPLPGNPHQGPITVQTEGTTISALALEETKDAWQFAEEERQPLPQQFTKNEQWSESSLESILSKHGYTKKSGNEYKHKYGLHSVYLLSKGGWNHTQNVGRGADNPIHQGSGSDTLDKHLAQHHRQSQHAEDKSNFESSVPPDTDTNPQINPDMPPKTPDRNKLVAILAGLKQKNIVLPSDFDFEKEGALDVLLGCINSSIQAENQAKAEAEPVDPDDEPVTDASMPFAEKTKLKSKEIQATNGEFVIQFEESEADRFVVVSRSANAPKSGGGKYRRPVHVRVYDRHHHQYNGGIGQRGAVEEWSNVDSRYSGNRSAHGQALVEAHSLANELNKKHKAGESVQYSELYPEMPFSESNPWLPLSYHGKHGTLEDFTKLVTSHGGMTVSEKQKHTFKLPKSEKDKFHVAAQKAGHKHGFSYSLGTNAGSQHSEPQSSNTATAAGDYIMQFTEEELAAMPPSLKAKLDAEVAAQKQKTQEAEAKAAQFEEERKQQINAGAMEKAIIAVKATAIPPAMKKELLSGIENVQFEEGAEVPTLTIQKAAEMFAKFIPKHLQFNEEEVTTSIPPKGKRQTGTGSNGEPIYADDITGEQYFESGEIPQGHVSAQRANELIASSPVMRSQQRMNRKLSVGEEIAEMNRKSQ